MEFMMALFFPFTPNPSPLSLFESTPPSYCEANSLISLIYAR